MNYRVKAKPRFKWFSCVVVGVLLLSIGGRVLGDRAPGARLADIPAPTVIEPTAIKQFASNGVLLVNSSSRLPAGYAVDNLVNLYQEKRSFQLASSNILLTRETFEAANQMFEQARRDGVSGFTVTSGYRTEDKQQELYKTSTNGTAAMPGTSEHQTGLAFDVTPRYDSGGFEDTEQFRWLSEHCWDFGFILRYPEGKEHITGIPYEPWHYRYVGADIARAIHQNGWTLEEYCGIYY